jgi:hypothetical protein
VVGDGGELEKTDVVLLNLGGPIADAPPQPGVGDRAARRHLLQVVGGQIDWHSAVGIGPASAGWQSAALPGRLYVYHIDPR